MSFLVVSGHRRNNIALDARIGAVPIVIRKYANEKEHRSDVSLLNKGQEPLSEIEEAFEIQYLKQIGWINEEIKAQFGWKSILTLHARLNLTKLDPAIQALVSPELAEKDRLPVTTAQNLGGVKVLSEVSLKEVADNLGEKVEGLLATDTERRFALQRLLLRMIKERDLNTTQSTRLINELVMMHGAGRLYRGYRSNRFKPSSRRTVLENLCTSVTKSDIIDWTPPETERILNYASYEDVEELLKKIESASNVLLGIASIVRRIKSKKHPTNPEVAALIKKGREKVRV